MTTADIIVTLLTAIAFAVGMTGIVVPILPGSILIIIAALIWAIVVGGWVAWVAFALIAAFSIAGITCSYVMTGRRLRQKDVPGWALFVAILGGVVGFFVIPGPGLIIGFVLALFLIEYSRRRDASIAWSSTWTAIKALGIGILLELALAIASATTLAIATIIILLS